MGNCNKKGDENALSTGADTNAGNPCREISRHHEGAITCINNTGKAGEIITCGIDKTICLLDWREGRVVQVWRGHSKPVNRVVYCRATGHLFSCSRDMTVRQWRRDGGEALQAWTHDLTVSALDVNTAGTRVCSGSRDVSVRVWDVATGAELLKRKIPRNVVTCMKWFEQEECFVQGSEDLHLRIWDTRLKPWEPAQTWGGYTYFPLCVDVSEDGQQVLTSSKGFNNEGAEARLWDRRMGKVVKEARGHAQDATACLFFKTSVKEHMIVTASKDETVKTWELQPEGASLNQQEDFAFTDPEGGAMFTSLALLPPDEEGPQGQAGSSERACLAASTFNGGLYILREDGMTGGRKGTGAVRIGLTCIAKISPASTDGQADGTPDGTRGATMATEGPSVSQML